MQIKSKKISLLIITKIYIVAFIAGMVSFVLLQDQHFLVKLFIADVVATCIVWVFGLLFKNSSVYDPYWSVAPIVILFAFSYYMDALYSSSVWLLLLAITFWGIRLTYNWAINFDNLTKQDWRYDQYKNNFPKGWFIINLFGINLMPTFVVFVAMLPAIYLIINPQSVNIFTFIAFAICILAASIQLVSDKQLREFKMELTDNSTGVCNKGLWGICRHPNYFAEILMWWGVYAFVVSINPSLYFTGIGAVIMTSLFVFISIPLMEKRQLANKPEYKTYLENTSKIIPIKKGFKFERIFRF